MNGDVRRMNSRSRLHVALLAMLAVEIALSNNASSAERDFTAGHRSKYRHVADIEATMPAGTPCRTGWWQTLRYGHVRPHWGTLCY
jgi:hypothetical protein